MLTPLNKTVLFLYCLLYMDPVHMHTPLLFAQHRQPHPYQNLHSLRLAVSNRASISSPFIFPPPAAPFMCMPPLLAALIRAGLSVNDTSAAGTAMPESALIARTSPVTSLVLLGAHEAAVLSMALCLPMILFWTLLFGLVLA